MRASLLAILVLGVTGVARPVDDPARLVPADALIYFGSTSLRAGGEASENTAMSRILGEGEVRSFLHEPLSAANAILQAGLAEWGKEIDDAKRSAREMGLGSDVDMPEVEDLKVSLEGGPALPLGRFFLALTHIEIPQAGPGEQEPVLPDVGVVIGLELLNDELVSSVRSVWSGLPFPTESSIYEGTDILAKTVPGAPIPMSVSLAFVGRTAILSTSAKTLQAVLDRAHGRPGAASLAEAPEYREMTALAGGLVAGASSYFVRVEDLAQFVSMGLQVALKEGGASEEEFGQLASLMQSLGMEALQYTGGVSAVGTDGRVYSTSVVSVDESGGGLIAALSRAGPALDVELLSDVPADVVGARAFALGSQLVDLYDWALAVVGSLEPGALEEFEQATAQMLGGSDLREDIMANIAGTISTMTVKAEGMMAAMGGNDFLWRVGMKDPTAFLAALENLTASLGEQFQFPVKLKASDHEGTAFYTLDLSATPMAMLQPALAVGDGALLVASTSQRLKTFLNGGFVGAGGSLLENPAVERFLASLGDEAEITSFTYADNAQKFSSQYGGMVMAAQMMGGVMGDLPLDLTKLPTEGVVTEHLDASYGATYRTRSGLDVTRSISQFQLTDFVPLALVAGVIYAGQELGIEPAAEEAEADPVEVVQTDLREIRASMTVYKIAEGRYPDTLEDLRRPLADFPDGAYTLGELPRDPWGNPYRYTLVENPRRKRLEPRLWSIGPNGVDDGGEGDDIVQS